jgi:hypothetical protein
MIFNKTVKKYVCAIDEALKNHAEMLIYLNFHFPLRISSCSSSRLPRQIDRYQPTSKFVMMAPNLCAIQAIKAIGDDSEKNTKALKRFLVLLVLSE